MSEKPHGEDVWIKTFCHGCLSATCGVIVHRVNGVVVGLKGDPENPYNQGKLCPKAYAQIMTLYDPYRPTRPMVRTNPQKGIGVDPRWKEVSWEEAIELAGKKVAEIRDKNPADILMSCTDVTAVSWVANPIMASLGSPNRITSAGYHCAAAVHHIPWVTMGSFHAYPDLEYCNYLVLWGSNKGGVIQHFGTTVAAELADARARGMKLVCIDPVQSNVAAKADRWVPIRPGTDMALALAWLNVLLNEGDRYDAEYFKRYTNGPYLIKEDGHYLRDEASRKPMMWDPVEGRAKPYDAEFRDCALQGSYTVARTRCMPAFEILKSHVAPYTPEWAAPLTTIAAATIRDLAREFGEAARIGSSVSYDGHVLPYRPAAIHWYAGVSQHVNGLVTGIAIQLINTSVGNLLVPGGLLGDGTVVEYPLAAPTIWTGKEGEPTEVDGMLVPSPFSRFGGWLSAGYPPKPVEAPKTHSARELFPVGLGAGFAMLELNNLHPELFNHRIPRPKAYLCRHASDMTNKGNPQEVSRVLRDVYQISFEPLIDETAEFADILFPVPVRLERLQLGTSLNGYAGGTLNLEHYAINFSQPVVPTPAREMMDIWGAIADRAGFREELNQMVNVIWDLQGEHRLEPEKSYTYREMQERLCKSLLGPAWDLEQLGQRGHVKWRKSVRERYPRPFIKGRAPVYYEYLIDLGAGLQEIIGEMGCQWDLADYRPLPAWRPGPAHRGAEPGYDLLAIPFRVSFLSHMWSTHNPWLVELGEVHPWAFKILMNATTAQQKGIRDGDEILIDAVTGYGVRGIVKLTECVHPEVVAISRHGGHWCSHPAARGKGVHFNTLIPHKPEYMDPMWGGLESCIRVKVTKAEDGKAKGRG